MMGGFVTTQGFVNSMRTLAFSTAAATTLALIAVPTRPAWAGDDAAARKLLQTVFDKNSSGFQTGQSKTSITLTLASGKSKTWTTLARVIRGPDGRLKTRATFLEPPDSVGTELLMLEQGKNSAGQSEVVQYLWLPKTKRLRRISGAQRNEPFMGTDFSFGDLEGKNAQAGTAKVMGPEAAGGVPCTKVEVAIADPADVYGKVVLWIDEKALVPRKIQFHDKAGLLVKTLEVERVKALEGGRSLMEKLKMINHLRNSTTTVETRDADSKTALPEALFTPDALGK